MRLLALPRPNYNTSPLDDAPGPILAPAIPAPTPVKRNRILVADDDDLVRGSLGAVLGSMGYVVDEAESGRQTVLRAVVNPPDLLLLDLNMPQWDGWTTYNHLNYIRPLLPVIVITARPNQYTKAVQLGVDAFMEKPLDIPILLRAIKKLTSEGTKTRERRITNQAFVTELLTPSQS